MTFLSPSLIAVTGATIRPGTKPLASARGFVFVQETHHWDERNKRAPLGRHILANYNHLTMERMFVARMKMTPVGPLVLGAGERGLALLEFDRGKFPSTAWTRKVEWVESRERLAPYVHELEEYFAGERRKFSFQVELRGTEFQKKCWEALLRIPYGVTKTYAAIANEVGCPQGFRAVGMANHDNPVAIVVPCHRVITTAGTLGGYGGGLPAKQWLLEREGVTITKQMAMFAG